MMWTDAIRIGAVVISVVLPGWIAASGAYGQTLAVPALDLRLGEESWHDTAIAGVQTATLSGDPLKPGLYILRVKIAKNAKLVPHTHPDVRSTTVLSGEMYFGYGESFDPTRMKVYPAGAILAIPANEPHYVWAKSGEVIVQDVGIGPTTTVPLKQ